nr:hypothetical protein [Candidatus Desulfatibia profunda]
MPEGPPKWSWQDILHVKPGDPAERGIQPGDRFVKSIERQIEEYAKYLSADGRLTTKLKTQLWRTWGQELLAKARGRNMMRKGILVEADGKRTDQQLGYPYFRRLGWQTKNKPVIVNDSRIVVPLYFDGF